MAEISLGLIAPTGNPLRATNNQADPTATVWAHSYKVQHWPGNLGAGYVGSANMNIATGEGIYGVIQKLQTSVTPDKYHSHTVESQQFPINMATVFLDVDNISDNLLVSYIEP